MVTEGTNNITFSLQEKCKEAESNITYEELLQEVDVIDMNSVVGVDDYIACEINYQTNYTKKELDRIADYYGISKRKKRKDALIEDIVVFEKDLANIEKVFQRKKLWSYVEEIKKDKYLRQFLILD